MERSCQECGTPIEGRVDKKFCSDQCRNTYNNRQNSDSSLYMRNVNNILRKNRRILENLNPGGKTKVHRNKLLARDFNFEFFTNIYTTKKGSVYYFCYEQGFLPLENDYYYLVVQKKDL